MMEPLLYIRMLLLIFLLTVIAIIDFRTKTIPDAAVVSLASAGLLFDCFASSLIAGLSSVVFYFGCFWLVRRGHYLATGRVGLGFGDVKMAGAAGAWITIGAAPLFMGLAAAMAILSVPLVAAAGDQPLMNRKIPFAPFLGASLLVCWLLQISNVDIGGFYGVLSIGQA